MNYKDFFNNLVKDLAAEEINAIMVKSQIEEVFNYTKKLANVNSELVEIDGLNSAQFNALWSECYFNFAIWSANINRYLRKEMAKYQKENDHFFMMNQTLYEAWWLLFHLITEHFVSYRRKNLREKEDLLTSKFSEKIKVVDGYNG